MSELSRAEIEERAVPPLGEDARRAADPSGDKRRDLGPFFGTDAEGNRAVGTTGPLHAPEGKAPPKRGCS